MANLDSGVHGYVRCETTVTVYFPVDKNGVADISCKQCEYYRQSYRKCGINGAICEYPEKFVSSRCPLHPKLEDKKEKEN